MKMSVFEDVPETTIDGCLQAIYTCGVTEEGLNFLMSFSAHAVNSDTDYRRSVQIVAARLVESVGKLQVKRWDFDLGDLSHPDQLQMEIQTNWNPPKEWAKDHKRQVLYGIVGCFRRLCHVLVDQLVEAFLCANNEQELDLVLKATKEKGVFIFDDQNLRHNHSILDSRNVWEAYRDALSRIKPYEFPKPTLIQNPSPLVYDAPHDLEKEKRNRNHYKKQKKSRHKARDLQDY